MLPSRPNPKPQVAVLPYHASASDVEWLKAIGILEVVQEPTGGPELTQVEAEVPTVKSLTPTSLLKFIHAAPKSVTLQQLIDEFGQDVMPVTLELMKAKLVKCWGPYFNLFYIMPDAKEKVEQILHEAGE